MDLWSICFIALYSINIISGLSMVFARKVDVGRALAWLLTFIFLPVVGFVLYFFFGSTAKYRLFYHRFRFDTLSSAYQEAIQKNRTQLKSGKISVPSAVAEYYLDMIRMNQTNANSVYTVDNTAELLVDAQANYTRMFAEIEAAKESIHVLYFIIKTRDESGKRFLALLEKKAREGVEVRVIYDLLGYLKGRRRDYRPLIDAGGMVYSYLPTLLSSVISVNYHMHRKIVVIDGRIAYTGGINIGDDYLGLDPKKTPWRDTAIRMTGGSVHAVQFRFLADWHYLDKQAGRTKAYPNKVTDPARLKSYFPQPAETGNAGVQIITSGPDQEYATIKDSYMKMVGSAKKYIYIQTPYLVPDESLTEALRLAARSGVDVRVMIPGIPDKKFVYYITLSHVEELLSSGIKVYTHKGFLHAKTVVMDDCIASVGSANFDSRSFRLDYEMNALVYDEAFARQCRNTFLTDVKNSRELTLENHRKRNGLQKICEGICRLIEPLV